MILSTKVYMVLSIMNQFLTSLLATVETLDSLAVGPTGDRFEAAEPKYEKG